MATLAAPTLCRAIAWLLLALLPLQAAAVSVMGTKGPAHAHRTTAGARLVLDDLRRAAPAPDRATAIEVAAPRHVHADGPVARHRHAAGDASVSYAIDDAGNILALSDDASSHAGWALWVALLPDGLSWHAPAPPHLAAPGTVADWRDHCPDPDERPPRSA